MKKVFIASDHGGVDLKSKLVNKLQALDYEIQDLGPDTKDSVDYPDFAHKVTQQVAQDLDENRGILICRSGIGMSLAANKVADIRAALVYTPEIATLARKHNNANVICFGADFISEEEAEEATVNFLTTDFDGGRHQKRVNKIGQR